MLYKRTAFWHECYNYNSLYRFSQILPFINAMSTSTIKWGVQGRRNKAPLRTPAFIHRWQKEPFDNLLRPSMPDFEMTKGRWDENQPTNKNVVLLPVCPPSSFLAQQLLQRSSLCQHPVPGNRHISSSVHDHRALSKRQPTQGGSFFADFTS